MPVCTSSMFLHASHYPLLPDFMHSPVPTHLHLQASDIRQSPNQTDMVALHQENVKRLEKSFLPLETLENVFQGNYCKSLKIFKTRISLKFLFYFFEHYCI